MKKELFVFLFAALALFATTASSRTAWPDGDKGPWSAVEQDIKHTYQAPMVIRSYSATSADRFNLLEFPAASDQGKVIVKYIDKGGNEAGPWMGSCMAYTKRGPRLQI